MMDRALWGAALACFLLLAASACVEIRVHRTSEASPSIAAVKTGTWTSVVFGFADVSSPVILDETCPDGWETLTTKETSLQFVERFFTLGIYSPWQVRVACTKPAPPPKEIF